MIIHRCQSSFHSLIHTLSNTAHLSKPWKSLPRINLSLAYYWVCQDTCKYKFFEYFLATFSSKIGYIGLLTIFFNEFIDCREELFKTNGLNQVLIASHFESIQRIFFISCDKYQIAHMSSEFFCNVNPGNLHFDVQKKKFNLFELFNVINSLQGIGKAGFQSKLWDVSDVIFENDDSGWIVIDYDTTLRVRIIHTDSLKYKAQLRMV